MYLRWKLARECAAVKRLDIFAPAHYYAIPDHYRYTVLLAESARVPGVKGPRQRTLACLGTVDEWKMSPAGQVEQDADPSKRPDVHPPEPLPRYAVVQAANVRTRFRDRARNKLTGLVRNGQIAAADAQRIYEQLAVCVPPWHYGDDGKAIIVPPLALPAKRHARSAVTQDIRWERFELALDRGQPVSSVPWQEAVQVVEKEKARRAALTDEQRAEEDREGDALLAALLGRESHGEGGADVPSTS